MLPDNKLLLLILGALIGMYVVPRVRTAIADL